MHTQVLALALSPTTALALPFPASVSSSVKFGVSPSPDRFVAVCLVAEQVVDVSARRRVLLGETRISWEIRIQHFA